MKKDVRPAAFTLKNTVIVLVACVGLMAFPALAVSVGGTELNATDLGGGEDNGGGSIVVNVGGGSTLLPIVIKNPGGGDVKDDDGGEAKVILNTGFSAVLVDDPAKQVSALPGIITISPDDPSGNPAQTADEPGGEPVVNFGLVERRPDFEYRTGSREFEPTPTYTMGQKGLGIGPGLGANQTKYYPLGEF